ncbi:MAG: hypothetical protein HY390_01545 [Deltaproteobacteria bacterium]|nr:hypothetical protein [Deltaproteobacteria bacterium]
MKLGIIDLGTNSLRFDIYQIQPAKSPFLLYHEKDMIRLGQQVFTTSKLSSKSKEKTLRRLEKIKKIAEQHSVDHMLCYGTSPLREAINAQKFMKEIQTKIGFRFQVISGKAEAKLIAKAMCHFHRTKRKTLCVDIGGGSTEISLYDHKKIYFSKSLNLGAMRLQYQYLKSIPPTEAALERTRTRIIEELEKTFSAKSLFSQLSKSCEGLASAGTMKALLTVAAHHKNILTLKELETFFQQIRPLTLSPLKKRLKTEGKRGDILLAGTLLAIEILRFFGLHSIQVTTVGLRNGMLLDYLEKNLHEE